MSHYAVTWAYKLPQLPSGQKFVLVTLCHHSDSEWSCYPSVKFMAAETGMSERTIRFHLDALEDAGAIKRDRTRNSDGTLGRYRYFIQEQFSPLAKSAAGSAPNEIKAEAKPVQPAAVSATGEKQQRPAAKSAAQVNRQKKNHQLDLSEALTGPFEALWAAWPAVGRERSSRKEAAAAFAKACEGLDPEAIVNAAPLWLKKNPDPQYFPGLHRWLAKRRFEHFLPGANVVSLRPQKPTDWPEVIRTCFTDGVWEPSLGPKPEQAGYRGPVEVTLSILDEYPFDHPIAAKVRANLQPERLPV